MYKGLLSKNSDKDSSFDIISRRSTILSALSTPPGSFAKTNAFIESPDDMSIDGFMLLYPEV